MPHCQLCRRPLNSDGSHPVSTCPVYTGEPVSSAVLELAPLYARQLFWRLDQLQAQLVRIERILRER